MACSRENFTFLPFPLLSARFLLFTPLQHSMGRDNVVSIVTCYGLEGPGIESRWGRNFPHLSRLALGPGAHPDSCAMNGCRVFPGGKGGRGVTLTTHPHLVPRSWKSRAIPLLPLWAHVACYRVKLYLYLIYAQSRFLKEGGMKGNREGTWNCGHLVAVYGSKNVR